MISKLRVFCTDSREYFEDGKITKLKYNEKQKIVSMLKTFTPIISVAGENQESYEEVERIDIAFIILHYMAVEDTIESIDSIEKYIDTQNYQIIVVDNCSPDDSYSKLQILYKKNNQIVIIHNEENLGFARGNNVGIDYVRKHYKTQFIVVMNNDTCIFQRYLYRNLCDAFNEYRFAVLGPMIITADGTCKSNLFKDGELSRTDADSALRTAIRIEKLAKYQLDRFFYGVGRALLGKAKCAIKKILTDVNNSVQRDYANSYLTKINCKLHGSFMVFSALYFEKFNGFDPRTFLYMEEDILYVHLMRNNLRSVYYPAITIFHKEDASTEKSIGTGRQKRLFINREHTKSIQAYIDVLDEYQMEKE